MKSTLVPLNEATERIITLTKRIKMLSDVIANLTYANKGTKTTYNQQPLHEAYSIFKDILNKESYLTYNADYLEIHDTLKELHTLKYKGIRVRSLLKRTLKRLKEAQQDIELYFQFIE